MDRIGELEVPIRLLLRLLASPGVLIVLAR